MCPLMKNSSRLKDPAPLFTAAAVSYAANCVLGVAVATRHVDTSHIRWLHHALFGMTAASTLAAVSSLRWNQSRAGWALLPAVLPLSVIPFVHDRGLRHVAVALAAAPPIAAGAVRAWR